MHTSLAEIEIQVCLTHVIRIDYIDRAGDSVYVCGVCAYRCARTRVFAVCDLYV